MILHKRKLKKRKQFLEQIFKLNFFLNLDLSDEIIEYIHICLKLKLSISTIIDQLTFLLMGKDK